MNQRSIRIGPFELREPIGSGGMGVVWLAVHHSSEITVAVKVIAGEFAWTERFRRAFRSEVRAAATLDHPHIVSVLDAGEITAQAAVASEGRLVANSPYLATEYMPGGSLARWTTEPRPWSEIRTAATGLLEALAHSHARGVIHRDVKPGNILLDAHDKPRLSDFGIAQMLDGEGPVEDLGTPAYMAPEQFARAPEWIGPWTDLYAFGCTLWAVLSGQPPWGALRGNELRRAHLHGERPTLRPMMAVPSGLEHVLKRAIAAAPNSRYYRAAEFAADLRALGLADRIGVRASLRSSESPHERTPAAARTTDSLPYEPAEVPHGPRAEAVPLAVPATPPNEPDASTRALRGAGIGLYGIRTPPLVGRKSERRILWETFATTAQGEGPCAVLLRGTTGTGKTRLASWLAEHAHASCAAEVWVGRHDPMEGAIGTLLQSWLGPRGIWTHDPQAVLRTRMLSLPDDPDDPQGTRLVEPAVLASIATHDSRVRFTHPNERYAALGSLLQRICLERLVLLRLEDLQWGADTLGLVRYLLAEGPSRLLIVGTIRDEVLAERPIELPLVRALSSHPRVSTISVGPLLKVDRQLLVQALLPLESSLAARIALSTSGLPLLAVQVIGDLVARGVLDPDEDGFRLRGEALPSIDLAEVWTQRLEALLSGAHAATGLALELAAVLGLSVDGAEWKSALSKLSTDMSEDMPQHLAERLVSSGLARTGDDPSNGFLFVHPMLRDVLLARAERASRTRRWHTICAEVLRHRPEIDVIQRRAHHLLEAGSPIEAAALWLKIARDRVGAGEYDAATEVLEWWETAMTESAPIHDPAWGQGWRARFELSFQRGDLDAASQWSERLLDHARWHGWMELECRALIDLASVRVATGRRDEASLLAARALELPIASEAALRARIELTIGVIYGSGGEHHAALGALARARAGFEALGLWGDAGGAARFEAVAALGAGDPQRAIDAAHKARGWLAEAGDRPEVAAADNALGEAYRSLGDLAAAERFYRVARDGMRRLGMAKAIIPEANLAILLLERGETKQAAALLETILASPHCRARPALHVAVHLVLLSAAALACDWKRFDVLLDESEPLIARIGIGEPDAEKAIARAADAASAAGEHQRAARAAALTNRRQDPP